MTSEVTTCLFWTEMSFSHFHRMLFSIFMRGQHQTISSVMWHTFKSIFSSLYFYHPTINSTSIFQSTVGIVLLLITQLTFLFSFFFIKWIFHHNLKTQIIVCKNIFIYLSQRQIFTWALIWNNLSLNERYFKKFHSWHRKMNRNRHRE